MDKSIIRGRLLPIVQCLLLLLFLKILPVCVYDDKYFLFVIHYVDVEKINEMK